MGTHPIFESDFDCLTEMLRRSISRLPKRAATTNLDSTCGLGGEIYGEEHYAIQETLRKIIQNDINPYCDKWEEEKMYPAHEVMKKLGDAGILGISHPKSTVAWGSIILIPLRFQKLWEKLLVEVSQCLSEFSLKWRLLPSENLEVTMFVKNFYGRQ